MADGLKRFGFLVIL